MKKQYTLPILSLYEVSENDVLSVSGFDVIGKDVDWDNQGGDK